MRNKVLSLLKNIVNELRDFLVCVVLLAMILVSIYVLASVSQFIILNFKGA